jgi:hypothetical protein
MLSSCSIFFYLARWYVPFDGKTSGHWSAPRRAAGEASRVHELVSEDSET